MYVHLCAFIDGFDFLFRMVQKMGMMYDMYKDFLGNGNLNPKQGTIRGLLQIGADIRQKLGNRAFLFDRYFTLILDAAHSISKDTMSEGFENFRGIYKLISAALENKDIEEFKNCSFYPTVKKYIESHPLSYYSTSTKRAFYIIALFDEYVMYILDQYMEEQADRLVGAIDTVWMKERYEELCELVGISLMEEFSQQIHLVFEIVPISKCFLQGALNYLIYDMTVDDEETGRYVMLVMMDKLTAGEEV